MLCTKVYVLHLSMIASSWVISHHSPPQELDFMYLSKIYCIYLYFIHTIKKRYVHSTDEMLRHPLGDLGHTLFELWSASKPPPICFLCITNPAYRPGCWSPLNGVCTSILTCHVIFPYTVFQIKGLLVIFNSVDFKKCLCLYSYFRHAHLSLFKSAPQKELVWFWPKRVWMGGLACQLSVDISLLCRLN